MNKNIIKGALGVFAMASLASCSSDYLDLGPVTTQTANTVTSTVYGARLGMYGICRGMYNQYQGFSQGYNGEQYFLQLFGETPSQDYFDTYYATGRGQWIDHLKMEVARNDRFLTCIWGWAYPYTLIGQCNDILAGIDGAEGSNEERNFVKGQVLTLRAHAYHHLLQIFAPRWQDSNEGQMRCIVERFEPTTGDAPLMTMAACLERLYADLDMAIECFKNAGSVTRTYNWEPNLAVCYGTYARVALLKQDWAKAEEMAHNAREGYKPMSEADYKAGFCKANAEWMWCNSDLTVDGLYYWGPGVYTAANGYFACHYPYGAGAINMELYNQIPEGDYRRDLFLTPDKEGIGNYFWNASAMDESTISIKAGRVQLMARRFFDAAQPQGLSAAYQASDDEENSGVAYVFGAQVKFWNLDLVGLRSIPFMRAAEMYLIEAEAAAEQGKSAIAQNVMTELNSTRQPGYTCTASGDALINEVRLYRRIELWGEGFNWFDFKRWKLPIERKAWVKGDTESGNIPIVAAGTVPVDRAYGWRYMIPYDEKDYNKAISEELVDY